MGYEKVRRQEGGVHVPCIKGVVSNGKRPCTCIIPNKTIGVVTGTYNVPNYPYAGGCEYGDHNRSRILERLFYIYFLNAFGFTAYLM